MPLKLVRQLNRDFSLYLSEWWREFFHENFKAWFGGSYSDYVAVNDGTSSDYYGIAKDEEGLRERVVSAMRIEPEKVRRMFTDFQSESDKTREVLARLEGRRLAWEDVLLLKQRFGKIFPALRIAIRVPTAWVGDVEKTPHGREFIATAMQSRKMSDGIFEAIDARVRREAALRLSENGLNPLWAKYLSESELGLLFAGKPYAWGKADRSGGYVLCKGTITLGRDFGKAFAKNGYFVDAEEIPAGSVLRGTSACKGPKVTGKARIILALEQLPSFRPGEVLVASMTVPDFAPAMRKAAAIVTDEGGITCHAAIVARELGKPCVIGTKFATKTLKDGDVVEVDSEKGTVRRL